MVAKHIQRVCELVYDDDDDDDCKSSYANQMNSSFRNRCAVHREHIDAIRHFDQITLVERPLIGHYIYLYIYIYGFTILRHIRLFLVLGIKHAALCNTASCMCFFVTCNYRLTRSWKMSEIKCD